MASWRWNVLRGGAFRLDGGAMFGVVPKALWARMSPPDEANRIALQTNCILLEGEGKKVLIEVGYGNKFGPKDRKIFALEERWVGVALEEAGVSREEIDAVIVSHLHFDHAGGLTTLEGDDPTPHSSFPNATIYTQKTEWEDALANKSTMTKTYLTDHLTPIQEQLQLIDGAQTILPGLEVFPVPGHTWGQQAILFTDDEGETVCFPGDMMPTIHHVGSAFNMAYDMTPYQNMLTKEKVLTRALAEDWRLVLDHEPGPPIVSVSKDERGRFALTPTAANQP